MKYILIFFAFLALPFLGCNNEPPTSPQEISVEKTEQVNSLNKSNQIIADFWSKSGQPITNKQAIILTNNYQHTIGRRQKIFIDKILLEKAIQEGRGVTFYFGKKSNGEFTVVSIPADINGKRIRTSQYIGNETQFITYTQAQRMTNDFKYYIGNINGRMPSKECIQRLLSGITIIGIWLHSAYDTDGNPTFVLEKATNNTKTFSATSNEPLNIKEDTIAPPPKDEK